jgi:hypothetical protein
MQVSWANFSSYVQRGYNSQQNQSFPLPKLVFFHSHLLEFLQQIYVGTRVERTSAVNLSRFPLCLEMYRRNQICRNFTSAQVRRKRLQICDWIENDTKLRPQTGFCGSDHFSLPFPGFPDPDIKQ